MTVTSNSGRGISFSEQDREEADQSQDPLRDRNAEAIIRCGIASSHWTRGRHRVMRRSAWNSIWTGGADVDMGCSLVEAGQVDRPGGDRGGSADPPTGEYPEAIRDFLVSAYRYALRVEAYVGLLTDRYPPFNFAA